MSELSRIFAEDPLNLTREDLDETIKFYRDSRKNFIVAEKAGKKAGSTKVTEKQAAASKAAGDIDLSDLLS